MQVFAKIFSDLPNPRDETAQHDLTEILFIALSATLCGAEHCTEMVEFGRAKEPLPRRFMKPEHGIPSHDTFSRVFRLLDPEAFAEAFGRFMRDFTRVARLVKPSGVVAIDGNSLKRAYQAGQAHMLRMMVSAWGAEMRMVLAQTAAPGGNEVDGALAVVELLSLDGCVVTADALHCHKDRLVGVCHQSSSALIVMMIRRLVPNVVHADSATNGIFPSVRCSRPVARLREGW